MLYRCQVAAQGQCFLFFLCCGTSQLTKKSFFVQFEGRHWAQKIFVRFFIKICYLDASWPHWSSVFHLSCVLWPLGYSKTLFLSNTAATGIFPLKFRTFPHPISPLIRTIFHFLPFFLSQEDQKSFSSCVCPFQAFCWTKENFEWD